jgi:peptide/nickel transport system permease protein
VTGYVIRRVFHAILVLLGVTIITFILQSLVASGPKLAHEIIGPKATPGQVRAFEAQYGLLHPLPVQYLHFLDQLLHGNLGYSYKLNISVGTLLREDLPKDLVLVGSAFVIAVVIAVPIGLSQAVHRNHLPDYVGTGVSFVLYSMPSYWLALLLIELLAVTYHVFPPEAPQGSTLGAILGDPRALVLPVLNLVLVNFALFTRYMRSSAIETLAADFVRTARAKGVPEWSIRWRHVLRVSVSPVVTLVGLSLPAVLTAGMITEYVFNFPGLGLAYYNAAITSDYPVELGITVIVGVVTVLGNLLADLSYAVLDPRIRYGRG